MESSRAVDVDNNHIKTVSIPVTASYENTESAPIDRMDVQVPNPPAPILNLQPIQPVDEVILRRSARYRRPAIPDDFFVYIGESDYNIGHVIDPVT